MSLLTTTAPPRRGAGRPQVDPAHDPQRRRDARPPLRLVEPVAAPRRRVRVGVVGTALLVVVVLGVFVLATVHTLVVQAQFELDRVDQQVAERQGELDALRLRVAEMESPGSIAEAATELGMVTPPERVYLEPVSGSSGMSAADS